MAKPKVAVVLFNLGGPDEPKSVQPFLFNLFNDPAIIRLPNPFRFLLAKLISKRRAPVAQEIYQEMGGGSPLVPLTQKQADALAEVLSEDWEVKVSIAMRYWHPMTDEAVRDVKAFAPDHIILLPLYPQFSTTTTASSIKLWQEEAKRQGLTADTSTICCYPTQRDFIQSHAKLIAEAYEVTAQHGTPRILFSAHGLPEKVVKDGDPYQWQCEETTRAVVNALQEIVSSADRASPELASLQNQEILQEAIINCYQSRVGPMKWIGPSTEDEIMRAGKEGVPLVVVPIAFVSEHSETLVELDIEYGKLAVEHGVPHYERVPALGDDVDFIAGLASACHEVYAGNHIQPAGCGGIPRICPPEWSECPCKI